MAVTSVSNTKDGKAAIRYATKEKSHNKDMERVLASSGSNLDPEFAMLQMKAVWDSAGKNNGKSVQMYRIIQSYSLEELDPENPADIEKANLMGLETVKDLFPDNQALVVTQADGEGGMLHNHILVNAVSAIDGKSLRGKDTTSWGRVSAASDKVIERHGLKPLVSKTAWDNRTIAEIKMAAKGKYVGKDDLKARILTGLDDWTVTNKDVFKQRMLDDHEVTVSYDNKGKSVSYSFIDENGKKKGARGTERGLGVKFSMPNIEEVFERNIDTGNQKREEHRLQKQADAAAAILAQPKEIKAEPSSGFSFDFGAELEGIEKRRKPKKPSVGVSKYVEPDMVREVREEREAKNAVVERGTGYEEALVMNAEVDLHRSQEFAAAAREEAERIAEQEKQKEAEAERQRVEALEQAEQEAKAKELQERLKTAPESELNGLLTFMKEMQFDTEMPVGNISSSFKLPVTGERQVEAYQRKVEKEKRASDPVERQVAELEPDTGPEL